jgi:hypothetical protein
MLAIFRVAVRSILFSRHKKCPAGTRGREIHPGLQAIKKSENKLFSGHAPRGSRVLSETGITFFHPDFTVGPGVSPDHALGGSP